MKLSMKSVLSRIRGVNTYRNVLKFSVIALVEVILVRP